MCLAQADVMVLRLVFLSLVVWYTVAGAGCASAACEASCEGQYDDCLAHQDPGVPGDPCGDLLSSCEERCAEEAEQPTE